MSELRLAAMWHTFRDRVVPRDASQAQLDGTKMAFYGGATAMLSVLVATLSPGDEPTDDDLRVLDDLDAELRAFAKQIGDQARAERGQR